MQKIFTILLICAISATIAFGQSSSSAKYPFGKNINYNHGYKPTAPTSATLQTWYNTWKTNHLRTCSNKGIMATSDNTNEVKVEGVGWALITSAYMGDKASFDGIYQFYNASSKLSPKSGGMMSWLVDCNGIRNNNDDNAGTASDGDLDAAFGLIVAGWQWGGNYLDSARSVLKRVRQLVTYCEADDLYVIAGGYNGGVWGGACNYTDISYYTPAFFRVFSEVSGDKAWDKLADDTYTLLERNAHATTGLVSDWQKVDGTPYLRENSQAPGKDTYYSYDACRTPWRITLDYLWNGNERAKAWATKISNWAKDKTSSLKEGYNLDGTPGGDGQGNNAGMAFLGALAVAAMANDQSTVNTFGSALPSSAPSFWYQSYLGNVYMLALTGNMWREDMVLSGGVKLNLTIDGKGFVKRNPDKYIYSSGESVTLTATPDLGYEFEGWSGEGSNNSKDTTITVTMSAARNITAKFSLSSGINFVKNGDFSQGMQDWTLNTWGNSQGSTSTGSGAVTITINRLPDANVHDLQLVQPSLPLLKGNTYVISFEAYAAAPRTIVVMSQLASAPWDTYFEETISLTTEKQLYSFEFEMEKNDDLNARLGFNLGSNLANVTIGNISVTFASSAIPSSSSGGGTSSSSGGTPMLSSQIPSGPIFAYATNGAIMLGNVPQGTKVEVYSLQGKRIHNSQISNINSQLIKVPANGIYFVKVGRQILRVAVR